MDIVGAIKGIGIIITIIMLLMIASQPGLEGKVFVLIIFAAIAAYWIYITRKEEVINPVTAYYQKLKRACILNCPPGLGFLILTGDSHHQQIIKGELLGFTIRINNKLPIDNPRRKAYIFLYAPDYGFVYKLPFFGWILRALRSEVLFLAYSKQLKSRDIIGNVEVKGITTTWIDQVETLNDWMFDLNHEMTFLNDNVEQITLVDNLSMLPTRIRHAIDSNAEHVKLLDTGDIQGGVAKTEER